MCSRSAEGFIVCDDLEAAWRQKSAQAFAATIVICNMCIPCKTGNRAWATAGCQMTLSVMTSHGVRFWIDIGRGAADNAE